MTYAIGCREVVTFVSAVGNGPTPGILPNAPAGKLKLTSFSSCEPSTLPLKDGRRLVFTSATCHFDLSTSRLAIFSDRLLATASRIASSNVSTREGDNSCAEQTALTTTKSTAQRSRFTSDRKPEQLLSFLCLRILFSCPISQTVIFLNRCAAASNRPTPIASRIAPLNHNCSSPAPRRMTPRVILIM